MADLTAARELEFMGQQFELPVKCAASDTYYKGGIYVLTNGYAAAPTDAANLEAAGVCTGIWEDGERDDAKAVGTTPKAAVFKRGFVWPPFSGAAQTDVGVIFFISDDQTLTKTAGSKTVGYRALGFKTGHVLINLACPDRIA